MPIYEYYCADCKRSFEMLMRAGESASRCVNCGSARLSREMSVFASGRSEGPAAAASSSPSRGGCCGGGRCGCAG